MSLALLRCLNHPEREAAYRCPGCKRDYCRECGAEHDGRMMCASCLKKLAPEGKSRGRSWSAIATAGSPLAGFFIAWMFFYYLGQLLLALESTFHAGRP
jgi:hypothetical protein